MQAYKPIGVRKNGVYIVPLLIIAVSVLTAALLSALSPFALYSFIYRGIYPSVMDAKIAQCGHLPVQGEVVKTFGLLFVRVKVGYEFHGAQHEKWARRLFTKRDGQFLKDKKYISVVPYKNTFGVLEERRKAE